MRSFELQAAVVVGLRVTAAAGSSNAEATIKMAGNDQIYL